MAGGSHRIRKIACAAAAMLVFAGNCSSAQVRRGKPSVPPGVDPGGIAVALIGGGLDYTDPEIARRLARDGEGEIIAWDFVDGDNRPFAATRGVPSDEGRDTQLAKTLLSMFEGVRLIPVRIGALEPAPVARAIAFVARTPARIVAMPVSSAAVLDWLGAHAGAADQILFVVPAVAERLPASITAPNLLVVVAAGEASRRSAGSAEIAVARPQASTAAASPDAEAVALAASLAACLLGARARPPSGLKAELVALARPGTEPGEPKTLDAGCPPRS